MNAFWLGSSLVALLLVGLGFGVRSNRRRRQECGRLEDRLARLQLLTERSEAQLGLERNVDLLVRAGQAAKVVETRVIARFPQAPHFAGNASRESILAAIGRYLDSESFRVKAGAAEAMFYAAWDGLDATPFAETIRLIAQDVAADLAVHGLQTVENAGHAAGEILRELGAYYHEHPQAFFQLLKGAFGYFSHLDETHLVSLARHLLDPDHLQIYSHALEPVAHSITEGIGHGSQIIAGHLQHLDLPTAFTVPDGTGQPHFHFPFITLALSSFREIRLLDQGKTELETSVKNAALDVAGSGGGGLVGAKFGAILGSALFPGLGTAVGAALGGFFGSWGGRSLTNSIKESDLNERKAEFDSVLASANASLDRAAKNLQAELSQIVSQTRAQYLSDLGQAPCSRVQSEANLGEQAIQVREAVLNQTGLFRQTLSRQFKAALAAAPRDRWFDPVAGGGIFEAFSKRLSEIYQRKSSAAMAIESLIPGRELCAAEPLTALTRLSQLPLSFDADAAEKSRSTAAATIEVRRRLVAGLVLWVRDASETFVRAVASLNLGISQPASDFSNTVKAMNGKVARSRELVLVELRKLGKA